MIAPSSLRFYSHFGIGAHSASIACWSSLAQGPAKIIPANDDSLGGGRRRSAGHIVAEDDDVSARKRSIASDGKIARGAIAKREPGVIASLIVCSLASSSARRRIHFNANNNRFNRRSVTRSELIWSSITSNFEKIFTIYGWSVLLNHLITNLTAAYV